jgi:hypothetical protein
MRKVSLAFSSTAAIVSCEFNIFELDYDIAIVTSLYALCLHCGSCTLRVACVPLAFAGLAGIVPLAVFRLLDCIYKGDGDCRYDGGDTTVSREDQGDC